MRYDEKEMAVHYLTEMLDWINNDEISITSIDYDVVVGGDGEGNNTLMIKYYKYPKKVYKKPDEIYQELYDFKYDDAKKYSILDDDGCNRDANIYATKNTVKVWRGQYE